MAKTAHHESQPSAESQNGQQPRGMIQPPDALMETYTRFLRQIETMNRQWFGSVRQTAEASWELASQMADSAIADGKRMSDFYLRLYEADLSAATSAFRHMGQETTSAAGRHLSAVQRSSAGD